MNLFAIPGIIKQLPWHLDFPFLQLTTPVVQSYVYLLYIYFLFSVHEIFHGGMTRGGLEKKFFLKSIRV